KLVVNAHQKAKEHQSQRTITNARNAVRTNTRARTMKATPQEELEQWLTREGLSSEPHPEVTTGSQGTQWQTRLKKYLQNRDNRAWEEYRQAEIERNHRYPVVTDRSNKGRLERYKQLTAAEAAIYVQIRTEKIGLNGFLKDRKVPN